MSLPTKNTAKKPTRKVRDLKKDTAKPADVVIEPEQSVMPTAKPNGHMDAGVTADAYNGLSSFLNANRKVAVRIGLTRDLGDITDRMQKCFYAVRRAYGGKQFPARGLDNGILANLLGAGLIDASGGAHGTSKSGQAILVDGEKPLMLKITASGKNYGIAA